MKRIFYVAMSIGAIAFSSCKESFTKTTEGMSYKIISDGKGQALKSGDFFEVQFDQTYNDGKKDTVLADSKNFGNQIAKMDSLGVPPVYYKIFSTTKKGDSIIIKQSTDSILKMGGGQVPPFIKKGQFIVSHYKIVNIFATKEQADSAAKAQFDLARQKDSIKSLVQLAIDDKEIAAYLAKNKITATKAPKGTYVEIITPGVGDAIDTTKAVKVNYTGKILATGKVFDSNTDTTFKHPQIFTVNMSVPTGGQGSVIKGWTDGLTMLKKGAKAKFYIPSALAYGSRGAGQDIKPNENLLFDIEVVDVISAAEANAAAAIERKKMEEMQKKMMQAKQHDPSQSVAPQGSESAGDGTAEDRKKLEELQAKIKAAQEHAKKP